MVGTELPGGGVVQAPVVLADVVRVRTMTPTVCRSGVRCCSDMYAHFQAQAQAQALSPDMTRSFIKEAVKVYAGTELRPDA